MKSGVFSVFRSVIDDRPQTLGEVLKFLDWASNREIREKGFRFFDDVDKPLSLLKAMQLIKDPGFVFQHKNIVFTPNGMSAVVFLLGGSNQGECAGLLNRVYGSIPSRPALYIV